MEKSEIIERIKKGNYSQTELVSWLQAMPNPVPKVKPTQYAVGDVVMHPIFKHPCLILRKTKRGYTYCMMTSEKQCKDILEKCNSRFFPNAYITSVLLFSAEIQGSFMGVYQNRAHLRDVFRKLKSNLL